MIRITADLDTKNYKKVIKSVKTCFMELESIREITIRGSNSKGYHIIVFTYDFVSKKDIFKIRRLMGDDPLRLKKDLKRKLAKQYLFKQKIKPFQSH